VADSLLNQLATIINHLRYGIENEPNGPGPSTLYDHAHIFHLSHQESPLGCKNVAIMVNDKKYSI
jgi:hypothetical protein